MVYGLIALAFVALIVLVTAHVERELYMLRWFDLANRSKEPFPSWKEALFVDRARPLRTFFRETIYGLMYTFTLVTALLFGWMKRRESFDGDGPLVVLIHGYKATSAHFWLMRWRLKRLGARNIITFTYDGKDPMVPYHRRLRDRILNVQAEGAPRKTLIVGQSFGGIIGFDYAIDCAEADEMVGLAALGTPFHGSRLAALGLSPLARWLAPDNPKFGEILATSPGCPFLSLYTRYDQFVLPWTNSEHPAATNVEIDTCGHAGLFFDRPAWRALRHWIKPLLTATTTGE